MTDTDFRWVVDPIHGDVGLTKLEWEIVDTPAFQRLRRIKQLGMAHLTYPNATHTRFAHSIGVFAIMKRILDRAERLELSEQLRRELRIAALLHDIGHYPYSHLMETIDKVRLIEEFVSRSEEKKEMDPQSYYPSHVELGMAILQSNKALVELVGGPEVATRIGQLFSRNFTEDMQVTKLISSSFDMDRLDYLLRDSRAAGIPYGEVDIHYLLNSLHVNDSGMVGVSHKCLHSVEHLMFARFFMHKTLYFHKTTFGLEEATRHLLRRIRDRGSDSYDLPVNKKQLWEIISSEKLYGFADSFVDRIIETATKDLDPIVSLMAKTIHSRIPPKLIREVQILADNKKLNEGKMFALKCKHKLPELADKYKVDLKRFIYCETRPLRLEKRGAIFSAEDARELESEVSDELIKIFVEGKSEPVSAVDLPYSILNKCANYYYQAFRLYFIRHESDERSLFERLAQDVRAWEDENQ